MSDVVGNPEDRFSHNEAHFTFEDKVLVLIVQVPGHVLPLLAFILFLFYQQGLCLIYM